MKLTIPNLSLVVLIGLSGSRRCQAGGLNRSYLTDAAIRGLVAGC